MTHKDVAGLAGAVFLVVGLISTIWLLMAGGVILMIAWLHDH